MKHTRFLSSILFSAGLLASPVLAGDVYVTGGLGASITTGIPPDGTWHQDGLPANLDRMDFAWKAGAGYTFGSWYVEGNYLSMGGISNTARFVPDNHYDAEAHVATTRDYEYGSHVKSTLQAGELVVGYQWALGPVHPRVHAGLWGGRHALSYTDVSTYAGVKTGSFSGLQLGATGGAGLCLGSAWQVCADVSYYQTIVETQFAFSKSIVLPTVSLAIPLTTF